MSVEMVIAVRLVDGTQHNTNVKIPEDLVETLKKQHGEDVAEVKRTVTGIIMDSLKFDLLKNDFTLDKIRSIEFRRSDCPNGCGHEEHDGPCGPESSTKKGGVWEP